MTRYLIRSGKGPFTVVSPETTAAQDVLHGNVGNHLFTHAIHKTLMTPGTEIVSNSNLADTESATRADCARTNEEFDAFIVPLANAFRPQFRRRLKNLTRFVKGLDIPVVVVGVGAQVDGLDGDDSELDDIRRDVETFVSAVLERSESIGVRGEFTYEYLRRLGFPDSAISIIGCPSVFLHGRGFRLPATGGARLDRDSRIAVSVTAKVEKIGEILTRQAQVYPQLTYVAQERRALELMLWGDEPGEMTDLNLPNHTGHPLYRQDRMILFLDPWPWFDYMREQDFAFGTRFHGNVAALLVGTPAMLLAHDSRTLELAAYHQMPFVRVSDVSTDVDASDLLARYDPSPFNAAYDDGLATYLQFLERNGLFHIYTPGNANPAFDEQLAATTFPPGVRTLSAPVEIEIARRLRWLRDATPYDSTLHKQAYRAPFAYPAPSDPHRALKDAVAKVTGLERVIGEQDKALTTQRETLVKMREELARHREALTKQRDALDTQREKLGRQQARLRAHQAAMKAQREQLALVQRRALSSRLRAYLGRRPT